MKFKENYQNFDLNEASTVAPSSTSTGQHQKYVPANSKKKVADRLKGGDGDKLSDDNFDPEELKMGQKEEMEHTNDPEIAKEIAKDHLVNDKKYYSRYKKVFGESVNSAVTSRKYEIAKAKNLTYKGWGSWADISGKTYAWDDRAMTFHPTGDKHTDDAASHFRGKSDHEVHKQGKNFMVRKKNGDVSKEEVAKELKSKYGDKNFHLSNVKTTDKDGKQHNSVMVRHDG